MSGKQLDLFGDQRITRHAAGWQKYTTIYENELQRLITDEGYSEEEASKKAYDYAMIIDNDTSSKIKESGKVSIFSSIPPAQKEIQKTQGEMRENIDQNPQDKYVIPFTSNQLKKAIFATFDHATYTPYNSDNKRYLSDSISYILGYKGLSQKKIIQDIYSMAYDIAKIKSEGRYESGSVVFRPKNTKNKYSARGSKASKQNEIMTKHKGYRRDKKARNAYKYILYYVADNAKEYLMIFDAFKKKKEK